MSPLTHHDILRLARPLVARGLRIELAHCDRERRLIAFQPESSAGIVTAWTLESIDEGTVELVRSTALGLSGTDADGADRMGRTNSVSPAIPTPHAPVAIACLSARVDADELDTLATAFFAPGAEPSWRRCAGGIAAFDEVLVPAFSPGSGNSAPAVRATRSIDILSPPLRLSIDASTTGGTPADLWLASDHAPMPMRRPTLASGAPRVHALPSARRAVEALYPSRSPLGTDAALDAARVTLLAALPDDLLAVASPRLRVLRWQGDHWKGAVALPARGERRQQVLDETVERALNMVSDLVERPSAWHRVHVRERWRVFARRLKPLAALAGILAVMPIAWLAVTRGGVELHPLLLGITPLLMVFMIVLSAREIPVMEWPPRPRPPARLPALLQRQHRSTSEPADPP